MEKITFDQKLKEFQDILKLPRQMRWLKEGFTICSNNILVADVPRELKLLYIILLMFAFKKGSCFPSVKRLADCLGMTRRGVQKNIRRLEDIKWIKIEKRDGKSSVYNLIKV